MNKWKKAISTLAAASLLASLLTTVAATSVFAFTAPCDATYLNGAYGTNATYCTNATERAADGASFIVLNFTGNTFPVAAGVGATNQYNVTVTTTSGKFITGIGDFAFINVFGTGSGVTSFSESDVTAITAGSQLWLTAPTAAGTASVTIQLTPLTGTDAGKASTDSITSFTWTGATTTTPSTAYSATKVFDAATGNDATREPLAGVGPDIADSTVTSFPADTALVTLYLWTKVADTNNNPIKTGATVEWTISGPAYFDGSVGACPAGTTGGGSFKNTSNAVFVTPNAEAQSCNIKPTGAAGEATITTTIKYFNVSYTLADKKVTFTGKPAKAVIANGAFSLTSNNTLVGSDTNDYHAGAFEVAVTDAAGNPISSGLQFADGTYTPANIFLVDLASLTLGWDKDDNAYDGNVSCSDTGTATYTVKVKKTGASDSDYVTSDPITFTCAVELSSVDLGALSVSSTATTVAPNGQTAIQASVKDKNGLPAPDGTVVTAVTNGVGAVVAVKTGKNEKGTSNGLANFIYLAPANAATATVTFFVANTTQKNVSVTLTIGSAATTSGTNGSQLGLSHSGSFTTVTKIQTLGHYVTWRLSFAAGTTGNADIWIATKNSAGVWSSFTKLTARVIDASGNAYFSWRSSSAKWISIKGLAGTVGTPARQARWR